MEGKRRLTSILMAFGLGLAVFLAQYISVFANTVTTTTGGAVSYNLHGHEYVWYSAKVPLSFLYENGSGFTRVEAIGSKVMVENYSASFAYQRSKEIAFELPIFGGFYNGKKYNYLVYGQQNTEEKDDVEVMRIVKYDKNWTRLGAVSYYGCNTYIPFKAGSISFAEYGDILYVRTCHTMYDRGDSLHHQANMTFALKQSELSRMSEFCEVSNINYGYVSHSFNQFIRINGDKIVAVDHGDAYPRGVVIGQYPHTADQGKIRYDVFEYFDGAEFTNVNLLTIPGQIGANYTGVQVGGFEVSSTHYLVALNSVDLDQLGSSRVKNVRVLTQPIGDFSTAATVTQTITSYAEDGEVSVSNPYLVPIENDQFALIWEEMKKPVSQYGVSDYYKRVMIAILDHEGKQVAETKVVDGSLSDCQPIYSGGKLLWYVTEGSTPIFYTVMVKTPNVTEIRNFVTRMYEKCLSREPDEGGLNGWAGQLSGGYMDGAAIAEQFVFSQELLSRNLSDGDFVETLYMAMMGRTSDAAGKSGWVEQLENGNLSRSEVTKSFVESTEFSGICADYGIVRGSYDASVAPIEKFVERLYKLCLERNADQAGLYGWVGNLKNGNMNGAQMANSFFFSDEFVNKNVSNEKYVELLYNTLMGRPADAAGKAGWVSQLQGGHMDRKAVMKAFIESTEFTGICENYGIVRGTL